jgi:hypothetical protein
MCLTFFSLVVEWRRTFRTITSERGQTLTSVVKIENRSFDCTVVNTGPLYALIAAIVDNGVDDWGTVKTQSWYILRFMVSGWLMFRTSRQNFALSTVAKFKAPVMPACIIWA